MLADDAHALFEEARERGRRRRRRNAVVLAVVGAACTATALTLLSERDAGRRPAAGDVQRPAVAAQSPRLFVQLLTRTEPLAVVDPAKGAFRLLKLPTAGGDPLDRLYVTGGRLIWNGPNGTYAINADLRGGFQKLADTYFMPSAADGRLWFISGRSTRRGMREPPQTAVEMTVRGRVTRRLNLGRACRGPIIEALANAFVCQDRRSLVAFDPATGSIITRIRGLFPFAAHGTTVAACEGGCDAVRMTDIASGRQWSIELPSRYRPVVGYDGAFSPDGSLVAVPAAPRGRRDDAAGPPLRIALLDVRRGTARVVPNSQLAADYRNFAWSSTGELFFVAGRGRLMRYRVGSARAELLSVNLPMRPILDLAAT